jgi:hypothetical protein
MYGGNFNEIRHMNRQGMSFLVVEQNVRKASPYPITDMCWNWGGIISPVPAEAFLKIRNCSASIWVDRQWPSLGGAYLVRLRCTAGVSQGRVVPCVVKLSGFFLQGFVVGAQGIDDDTMRSRHSLPVHVDKGDKPLEKKLIVRAEMDLDV